MRVLGIFAKWPFPGQVKTRLAAATSPAFAAAVAKAFLLDSLDRLERIAVERVVVFSPLESRDFFAAAAGDRFRIEPQRDGHLGERMAGFIESRLVSGDSQVVLLGTDSPTLPVSYVEQAFRDLDQAHVVFGPATDGGYYLVGCGPRLPPIFSDCEWGHSGVLARAVEQLKDSTWRVALLPPWYDVDTLTDWRLMTGHIAAMRKSGIDPEAPRTEALSASLQ